MQVKDLIEELKKYQPDTEVEVMVGFSTVELRSVSGDNEEGVYLEIAESD